MGKGQWPVLRGFTLALVLLGVCVFAWGLRYKLSLYQPPHSVGHRVPVAKLLITRERVVPFAVDLRQAGERQAQPGMLTTWLPVFIAIVGWGLWIVGGAWREASPPGRCWFGPGRSAPTSVRPPPCIL